MSNEDFKRVNTPRVEKVLKMLDNVHKSAKSYKVTDAERDALLGPVINGLAMNVGTPAKAVTEAAPQQPTTGTHKAPRWQDMRAVVADATEQELIDVLSIISVRLDDLKHERNS